ERSPALPLSDAEPQADADVDDRSVQRAEERVRGNAGDAVHRRQVGPGEAESKLAAGPPEVTGDVALDGQVAEHRDHEVQTGDVAPVAQVADAGEAPGRLRGGVDERGVQGEVVLADVELLEPAENQQGKVLVPLVARRVVEVLPAECDALVPLEVDRVARATYRLDHRRRSLRDRDAGLGVRRHRGARRNSRV